MESEDGGLAAVALYGHTDVAIRRLHIIGLEHNIGLDKYHVCLTLCECLIKITLTKTFI